MNTVVIKEAGKNALKFIDKNSPTILTILGSAGVLGTVVTTVRGTLKAEEVINERIREKWQETGEDTLTKLETVQTCWKCYVPTVLASMLTIGAIVGSNTINAKRYAALAGAYALSTDAFKNYKEKVAEMVTAKKKIDIDDAIAKDHIEKNPPDTVVFADKDGVLCYDVYSGRYFKCDIEKIRKIQNDLNQQIFGDMCVSLNELYFALDEVSTTPIGGIKLGDDLGWNSQSLIDFKFSSQLSSDGTPVLVIDHNNEPMYNYREY